MVRKSPFLIASLLLAFSGCAVDSSPELAMDDPAEGPTALQGRAPGSDEVPVIVELNMDAKPEWTLMTRAVATQRLEIRGLQDALIGDLKAAGLRPRRLFRSFPHISASVPASSLPALSRHPAVKRVHSDQWHEPAGSDPDDADNLDLTRIGAPAANDLGARGDGTIVAVLDTGVEATHPALAEHVVAEACFSDLAFYENVRSTCPNGKHSQVGPGAAEPCDVENCSHGTRVAGVVHQVAPAAKIIAVQVGSIEGVDRVSFSDTDIIAALDWLGEQRDQIAGRLTAVNLSLGHGKFTSACDDYVLAPFFNSFTNSGVAMVVAAGNEGYRDGITTPACITSAVAVGASYWRDGNDIVEVYSNASTMLDFFAPGIAFHVPSDNGEFYGFAGTSCAAPHVAGALAALHGKHPTSTLTRRLQVLKDTGYPITELGYTVPRIQVDTAAKVLSPDLQVVGGSAPASVVRGTYFTVTDKVQNTGLQDAGASRVGYYLSSDTIIDARDVYVGSRYLDSVREGAVNSASTQIRVPASTPAGSYTLAAVADYENKVKENNRDDTAETNNVRVLGALRVTVGPDLVVSYGAVDALWPVFPTMTFTVNYRAKNQGPDSTGAGFRMGIYLSKDTWITTSDTLLVNVIEGTLGAGAETNTRATNVTAPLGLPYGTYYVGVIVDSGGVISESSESNNTRVAGQITLQQP
ncbi:MAG: S8 family serine peptidase [Deltaproteobacteria bacterium]|nr:S8 family serine peptidase [Deltaproteobacteria bacterium]